MDETRIRRGDIVAAAGQRADIARRRRLFVTLLAAFVVLVVLFGIGGAWADRALRERSGATSFNFASAGFRAAFDLASRRGYRASRFMRAYTTLPEPERHVLVVLAPGIGREDAAAVRTADLERWVERGGRALIALRGPSVGAIGGALDALQEESALGAAIGARPSLVPAPIATSWTAATAGAPRFVFGAVDKRVAGVCRRYLWPQGPRLPVFAADDVSEDDAVIAGSDDGALAIERSIGKGTIVLASTAYPWSNAALRFGETGAFVDAILDRLTRRDDGSRRALLFDERTHGLGGTVGVFAFFFHRPTLWLTLSVVLGALLLVWVGAVRFGAPRTARDVPRRAREEFVVSMADLYARGARHDVALQRVVAGYEDRLQRAAGRRADAGGGTMAEIDALREAAAGLKPDSPARLTRAAETLHEIFEAGMAAVSGRGYSGPRNRGPGNRGAKHGGSRKP